MWTSRFSFSRLPSSFLDYARHIPQAYVERAKRTVPLKVFTQRFGAPDVIRWRVHPDDYIATSERPWEQIPMQKALEKENKYTNKKLSSKFYRMTKGKITRIPDIKWTLFVGDKVEVMVGKDKGKQGTIMRVSRETNEVWVEGMNAKLEEEMKGADKFGIDSTFRWKEEPLNVEKGHVRLVDPNDEEGCDAKWIESKEDGEFIRVSARSGFTIPIPSQAFITYEYVERDKYMEVEGKDTTANKVLERTYVPKLATFTQEISEHHGLQTEASSPPSYWY